MNVVHSFTVAILTFGLVGQLTLSWRENAAMRQAYCDAFQAEYTREAANAVADGGYEIDEYEYSEFVGRGQECIDDQPN